ncbi:MULTISPECIES: TolC family protein [Sphingobacterium]|uniref:Transporter n=1 Tax=Sphingobacterium cellulitidis TaxID=1768011 RepID=A0A8H9G0X5_9SPHI|nr:MULTISPECIES: TolC family protein [Sphingobacterium]MBA8988250.1 outer membrane protein TolC [Sphingobacterium soli]OYD43109.1 transporter [Sphingobacterium cellulitidis]OYD47552.1 transporter [Sphingobacterium cellulitidis]WFB62495.1 TolC family protein [Sphingobacterium sp. WM]GGE30136.1 transporter [Sphingobacterium soli]
MNRTKLMALMIAGMLSGSLLHAQETLTLQEAVKFALQNKAEAKKAKLEIENSEYLIDEVRAGALPQVNGSASLTYNALIQKSALDGALMGRPGETIMVAFGQPWQANAVVQVSQQLFNQSLFTGLKAARSTRDFYLINAELSDEQLIERVANAYYEVYQSDMQLNTINNNLENTNKTRDVLKGMVDAGLMRKIDLDRTEVAINNLLAQKQQIVNAQELRENALKFAIGMKITDDIVLPKETFDINGEFISEEFNVDNRTEVKLVEKQIELLELNKKSMVAAYYPSLSLTGNLGYLGFGQQFPIFNNSASFAPYSAIGLNLSIPIFNGGSTKAKINQANVDILKAKVDLEDNKLGLNLAAENAKAQIKNSLLTVDNNRRNVEMAKEVMENTQNNYRNGLATLTELLDSENAYADAQNNLNTSLLNYKVAEIQVIKANGKLKTLVNE